MSSEQPAQPPKRQRKSTPSHAAAKPARARASSAKTGQTADPKAGPEPKPKKSKPVGAKTPKPKRLCGACHGPVALAALYCRHCGKALSAEVPANPFLPPPPKPWRPSRIPRPMSRHMSPAPNPAVQPTDAPSADASVSLQEKFAAAAPGLQPQAAKPVAPQAWDPVPEIEQRIAHLKAAHDLMRPQLARADLFKRRLRHP
jgi:hypothetical protein